MANASVFPVNTASVVGSTVAGGVRRGPIVLSVGRVEDSLPSFASSSSLPLPLPLPLSSVSSNVVVSNGCTVDIRDVLSRVLSRYPPPHAQQAWEGSKLPVPIVSARTSHNDFRRISKQVYISVSIVYHATSVHCSGCEVTVYVLDAVDTSVDVPTTVGSVLEVEIALAVKVVDPEVIAVVPPLLDAVDVDGDT